MREIVLDTETTGISSLEGHRIIEIGAVEMVNKYRTGKTYQVYINPEFPVSEGAFKVHGISNEFLKDKPKFKEVARDFLDFIGESKLVIHNAPFDLGFLNHHLFQLKIPIIQDARVFDTLDYARKKYPGGRNSLDALCQRFNIDLSGRTHHGALLDSELLADVYAEMMGVGANQRNLMFAANNSQTITNMAKQEVVQRVYREARQFDVSAEEYAAHAGLLAKLKDPLWKKAS